MRKVRAFSVVCLSLALVACALGMSQAAPPPASLVVHASVTANGKGRLLVGTPGSGWRWESCTPALAGCSPVPGGRELQVPAGRENTVFVVRSQGRWGISPEWRGTVKVLGPPAVEGEVRAGADVIPVRGRWAGGWKGEYSEFQLAACTDPDGGDCQALTDRHYLRPCAVEDSLVLPPGSAGRYLRVAERRIGAGPPIEPAYAVTYPGAEAAWPAGAVTAVTIVGQILPALGPSAAECGRPAEPRAWISPTGIGSAECPGGCEAELVATRDGRRRQVRRTAGASGLLLAPPPLALRLSPAELRQLGPGRLNLAVNIDGRPLARRTVLNPAPG